MQYFIHFLIIENTIYFLNQIPITVKPLKDILHIEPPRKCHFKQFELLLPRN